MFTVYRKGQGSSARISVGVALGLLSAFASYSLHGALIDLPVFFVGASVPLLNIPLTWGVVSSFFFFLFCIAFAALLVGCLETGIGKIDNTGKGLVGFLVDTQAELNKVSWPTKRELIGSSIVVIIFSVIIGSYIFGVDRVVTLLMKSIGVL